MINQAICIDGLVNHLLCPMQCHLNGIQINEVRKFFAENPSETTHAIEIVNPSIEAHPSIIPLQLNRDTSYFDDMIVMISLTFISLQRSHLGIYQKLIFRKRDSNS